MQEPILDQIVRSRQTRASQVIAATLRVEDIFKIGLGPSSSHTVGPMRAACDFVQSLEPVLQRVHRLSAVIFGSLAWTGKGHATDKALVLGFTGAKPDAIDPDVATQKFQSVLRHGHLRLPNGPLVDFDFIRDIVFDRETQFSQHPNAMRFTAFDGCGNPLRTEVWFSVGGGFVVREGDVEQPKFVDTQWPYSSADELLAIGRTTGLSIGEIVLSNARENGGDDNVYAYVDGIAAVMLECIERGLSQGGILPGGLGVRRRAKDCYEQLVASGLKNSESLGSTMGFVSAFAMAVNEENAAGGRVVTAPTNGASGVIPAVLRYYLDFCPGADKQGIRIFLLTATAIGGIIKCNASISGAEVGCQGEVGSASSMAAAGLTAALGGNNAQIENAAEIALEHHLGMTCDPIAGLVQIPCIERNAFGAVKAINASVLALRSDGTHKVTFDQVVETMLQTGRDMQSKYRETSRGGLAVNVPEC